MLKELSLEEMNKEALDLAERGLASMQDRPEDDANRVIAELIAFVIAKFADTVKEDTSLGRIFIGTLIILQGLAVVDDDRELILFGAKMKEFAYVRMLEMDQDITKALEDLLKKDGGD